ncbi:gp62 [Sphingomonas phage PAU]|uniref:gp62 n=1 Tax=Sphingomonas phage PAU TaxID=1150991 RepID=UPI00025731C8|nr:gp62 [Sphingomonas phage PAU]AFF28060.1 gp62 [Sphingomonas phage PAU]
MSKMSSLAGLAMLSALGAMEKYGKEYYGEPERESKEPKEIVKPIPNGCKEYVIEGKTIIAISEKSAMKKFKRKYG